MDRVILEGELTGFADRTEMGWSLRSVQSHSQICLAEVVLFLKVMI